MASEYFANLQPHFVVNVLGAPYSIYLNVPEKEDTLLQECDGYCDYTAKRIVVCEPGEDYGLADLESYKKRVIRHELIHAFLFESGLGSDAVWQVIGQAHPEQTVDWIARQFPKLMAAFQEVGAL